MTPFEKPCVDLKKPHAQEKVWLGEVCQNPYMCCQWKRRVNKYSKCPELTKHHGLKGTQSSINILHFLLLSSIVFLGLW